MFVPRAIARYEDQPTGAIGRDIDALPDCRELPTWAVARDIDAPPTRNERILTWAIGREIDAPREVP